MICEICRCVFCWDDADEGALGGDRKRYCSDTCVTVARRRRVRRRAVMLRLCIERPKPAYLTEHDALLAAAELRRIPPLTPYKCPCGSWHLTSQPPAASPSPAGGLVQDLPAAEMRGEREW